MAGAKVRSGGNRSRGHRVGLSRPGRLLAPSSTVRPRPGHLGAMTAGIRTITIDCADPGAVGRFWELLLGWPLELESDGSQASQGDAFLTNPAGGPNLLFQRVPEPKRVKNRVHLDLGPTD